MGWIFTLCLMFLYLAPFQFVCGINTHEFPFVIKRHRFPEQSPTNVITDNVEVLELQPLICHFLQPFNHATAILKNTGHTISVKIAKDSHDMPYVKGGPLFEEKYEFHELHMHWGPNDLGSEHEINGLRYAMEVHMVNFKKDYCTFENATKYLDGICVVGVFLEISEEDNPEMNHFIKDLDNLHDCNSTMERNFKTEFEWINDVALKQKSYFSYHGSLTTTPFTECVIWILFTNPIPISENQLKEFRELKSEHGKVIKTNDRELQDFNGRYVIFVD